MIVAFDRVGDDVACVQAKLAFHNGSQNMLTGWFTADYACGSTSSCPADVLTLADSAGRHLQPHPAHRVRRHRGVGPVQRDRGRRPRCSYRRVRLPHRSSRFHYSRRGQQRPDQLGPAAIPLVQGLPPDLARAHAPPRPAVAGHRYRRDAALHHAACRNTDHRVPEHGVLADHRLVASRALTSSRRSSRRTCTFRL